MWLTEQLVAHSGRRFPMVGAIPGSVEMTPGLQHFGYCECVGLERAQNEKIRGHEFHHSRWTAESQLANLWMVRRRRKGQPAGKGFRKQAACLVRAPLLPCQPRGVPVLDEQGQNGRLMICCLGVGPGDLGYLTLRGRELIETAEVVAGFKTVVDLVRPLVRKESQVVTMGTRTKPKS